jgi:acyl carrier protein
VTELVRLVADVLQISVDEVDDDTGPATTAAWSSLRHVEIISAVQDRYGVTLTPREARSCRSVGRLRDVLTANGVAP